MTRDDLLGMLDMDGPGGAGDELEILGAGPAGGPAGKPADAGGHGPNAMVLDRWAARRGAELAAEHPAMMTDAHAMADFHAAAFDLAPKLAPGCSDALRHRYMAEMLETPEYRALHHATKLNASAAEIAAMHFAQTFYDLHRREDEEKEKAEKSGRPADPSDEARSEMRVLGAAGSAVAAAAAEVRELGEAAAALGMGGDGAEPGAKVDHKALAAAFKRVKNSDRLRRIVESAGRYMRLASSRQRRKTKHGRDEVTGIELGGELARLLASEQARLVLPQTRLDTVRRVLERQAMVWEFKGTEKVGKGPIVVVVDESGSMSGRKIENAKGLALAMARIARKQNRWCALIGFSGGTEGNVLALPPGGWDEAALMDWLEHFYSGGTDMDVPLVELPFKYWPDLESRGLKKGKTDVLIVTDAICDPTDKQVADFNAWKSREQARLQTIVVGCSEPGRLAEVSDEVHLVPRLGADTAAAAAAVSV